MTIREFFIQKAVLDFFLSLSDSFMFLPFDVVGAIECFPGVKSITYQGFADMHNINQEQVALYAESEDGATYYDESQDWHMILYNGSTNTGRQRFTLAHELGHIFLHHLREAAKQKVDVNNLSIQESTFLEREADWFASMLLCPFPVLRAIGVQSASQIQELCHISYQASLIKYEQLSRWTQYHRKTSWENNVLRLFDGFIRQERARQYTAIRKTNSNAFLSYLPNG